LLFVVVVVVDNDVVVDVFLSILSLQKLAFHLVLT